MPILGTIASSRATAVSAYTLIAESRLTSAASEIDFTSIPSTYAHLEIWCSVRTDTSGALKDYFIQVNGDTGNNYSLGEYYVSYSTQTGMYVTTNTVQLYGGQAVGNTAPSNVFAATLIQINDYASTSKYKTTNSQTNNANSGGTVFSINYSGVWKNTNAINRLRFYPGAGTNFTSGTYISIFGLGA